MIGSTDSLHKLKRLDFVSGPSGWQSQSVLLRPAPPEPLTPQFTLLNHDTERNDPTRESCVVLCYDIPASPAAPRLCRVAMHACSSGLNPRCCSESLCFCSHECAGKVYNCGFGISRERRFERKRRGWGGNLDTAPSGFTAHRELDRVVITTTERDWQAELDDADEGKPELLLGSFVLYLPLIAGTLHRRP